MVVSSCCQLFYKTLFNYNVTSIVSVFVSLRSITEFALYLANTAISNKMDRKLKKPKISSAGLKRNAKHRKRATERMRAVVSKDTSHKQLVDVVNSSDTLAGQSPIALYEEIKQISNARERSKLLFEWLIKPIGTERFFK